MFEVEIPETITIGGFTYSVEISASHDRELSDSDNWGEHSARLRRIRIASNCSPQQFSATYMHEILHAIDSVYQGAQLSNQEVLILANGLLQVLEQLGIRFVRGKA